MNHDDRLIVALDFPTMEQAKAVVLELGDNVSHYKVGMELYYAAGSEMIRFLKGHNKQVFLDLKLQDIPNTVAGALASYWRCRYDEQHAVGGKDDVAAVKSVREAAAKLGRPAPKLIAVTILTSMDDEQFGDLNYKNTIAEQVIALAKLAQEAGMDGVVASPQEAAGIRSACGPEFLIVTPGVRPAGASIDDQSRIATPVGAFKNGSSHIVVGRPITKAEDKIAAAQSIVAEIRGV
ncbi:MAG: orotidine-5'-phosphate decarboxylase [Phascolarctobacterium faecium]